MKLKFLFGRLLPFAMLLSLQSPALAQSHLVNIGTDSNGDYFFLDKNTVRSAKAGQFQIKQLRNNQMIVLTMSAGCAERRIWTTKIEGYDSTGNKLFEKDMMQESTYQQGSPSDNALRYYCKAINADG